MTQPRRSHKKRQKARHRRLEQERERLAREQARAPRALETVQQAIQELGLPETVAEEVQWRLQAQQKLLGKIFAMMFPPRLWLPQLSGAVSRAGLGQAPAGPDSGCPAQASVGEALAAAGAGTVGAPVAARRGQQPGHPQSVAVDVGGRRPCLQKAWPATGLGRPLVQRPGTSRPARHRWPAAACGDWRGQAGHPCGLRGASPRPGGVRAALPRQTDVVAGHWPIVGLGTRR